MSLVAIVVFAICVILFLLLVNSLANRKKINAAYAYGRDAFDIELPQNLSFQSREVQGMSDEGAFLLLLMPYFDSLSADKQAQVKETAERLKYDLKIDKGFYDRFMAQTHSDP